MYRAAIIGCGRIGSQFDDIPDGKYIYSHAGAYLACVKTSLLAVCDSDATKALQCRERWNVSVCYQDAPKMLAEQQPEIVSICTPDNTHYPIIRTVIETPSVRAILTEKPLALNLAQAEEIVALAKARNIVLAVNYSRRYAASHIQLKAFLANTGIGNIQTVSGYYTKGVVHNGTHWFDLARFLVGEVIRVEGIDIRKENTDDPTLDAILEFAGGARAYLYGCDEKAFSVFEMDLIGTRGRVRLIDSIQAIEYYNVIDDPQYQGYRILNLKKSIDGRSDNMIVCAVENVVNCLEQGDQPYCSGADGVAALRIALAVRASAKSGQRVMLSHIQRSYHI